MTLPSSILITGANRGIGLGLTRHFLARGWRVLAACRQPRVAGDLSELARIYPGHCIILTLDVREAASITALAAGLIAREESLDVLVNNAGVNPVPRDSTIDRVNMEIVADTLDINLLGALRMLQATVPVMRSSARPRIINISSGAGSLSRNSSTHPQPAYCISKAALNMLTLCAARDLPGFTIVSISPGWIRTDMGGADAELGLDEATAALTATIESLKPSDSGKWLDRFGQLSPYAW